MKNNYQVIVIGAGIAGLVAAYELRKEGIDVVILESSGKSGGRMATEKYHNTIIDTGAQFLSSGYPIISGLIKEFEIESEFALTSPYCSIVKNGKPHTFRYDKPFSLLFSGLLSLKEWLYLGIKGKKLYNNTKLLPVNDYSAWHQYDNQNCFEWANNYYGTKITDYIIEPMLEAFYFQRPEETSKALSMALNKIGYEKSKTMALTGGIALLPGKLSEKIKIIYDLPVENIVVNHHVVTVNTTNQEYRAQKVILATPAPVAAKIFEQPNEQEKKLLATQYSSTVTISIGLKNKLSGKKLSKFYGLWLPGRERKYIAAIAVESRKSRDRVATGELLNVMLSGSAGKKMINLKKEKITELILEELSTYFPTITDNISFIKITRWPCAEPMSCLGRSKDINEYRAKTANNNRIFLAGDYMGMPFTEGAAESGQWAAAKILSEENREKP